MNSPNPDLDRQIDDARPRPVSCSCPGDEDGGHSWNCKHAVIAALPTNDPVPAEYLAESERQTRLRAWRLAAELTIQTDWPYCPMHVVPLRDDATCGWCVE